jgi:excisionase family DNA binding protein
MKQPTNNPDFFRSAKSVAQFLGLSERSVRRMLKNHSLPYTKLGGALLVRRADLEETIAAATFPSHAMLARRRHKQRTANEFTLQQTTTEK